LYTLANCYSLGTCTILQTELSQLTHCVS